MDAALWLLHWLRLRAWFRRMFRNAGTLRGAVFLAAGLLFFALVVGPNFALRLMQAEHHPGSTTSIEQARRMGPLLLFAYCAMTVLFSSAEQGIAFTPAEVQFLFSGPFSRRQVLAYKIAGNALLCCVYALFLAAFFFSYTGHPLAAYLGLVLTLWFIQVFSLTVSLLLNTIGVRAVTWPRRLLLIAGLTLAAWGLAQLGGHVLAHGPGEILSRLEANPVVQLLLTPMRWFVAAATARQLWPEFAENALRCVLVDAFLVLVVFLLDAQYQEASAAASERAYARLQRIRSGGAAAAVAGTGRPRFRLPPLPTWGGVGTLAWRQLTTGVRSLRPVIAFLVVFTLLIGGSWLTLGANDDDARVGGLFIGSTALAMTVAMLTPFLTFDFRGDLDRMDLLKALPLPAWRVALGQLLAPTVMLTLVQLFLMGFVQLLWGGVEVLLLGVMVFALPFNFLSFALENVLFLWFPARLAPSAPGDFQMMGRQTLLMLVKLVALAVVLVPSAVAAAVAYLIASQLLNRDGLVPAVAAAWIVLTALSSGFIPLVALAFRSFDVVRDTPP